MDRTRAQKIRHAGHFVDQKLKYVAPKKQPLSGTEPQKGIELTPSQDSLMNALMQLLHEKSECKEVKSEGFYGGNEPSRLVSYGKNGTQRKSVIMRISPAELYKTYLGKPDYSGSEIKLIQNVFRNTERQKFHIAYDRHEVLARGQRHVESIDVFQSLFKILVPVESDNPKTEAHRGNLVIALNPLLTDQIKEKYVEYPLDINRKTITAAGSHRSVTTSVIALRDYLLRELSAKRSMRETNEDSLTYVLRLGNYVKQNRKKRLQARILSAIQVAQNLGLIVKHERVVGAEGQWKYVFYLNLDFRGSKNVSPS